MADDRTSVRIPFVRVRPNQAVNTAAHRVRVQATPLNSIATVATRNAAAIFKFRPG
jgi:hypothetical protein